MRAQERESILLKDVSVTRIQLPVCVLSKEWYSCAQAILSSHHLPIFMCKDTVIVISLYLDFPLAQLSHYHHNIFTMQYLGFFLEKREFFYLA